MVATWSAVKVRFSLGGGLLGGGNLGYQPPPAQECERDRFGRRHYALDEPCAGSKSTGRLPTGQAPVNPTRPHPSNCRRCPCASPLFVRHKLHEFLEFVTIVRAIRAIRGKALRSLGLGNWVFGPLFFRSLRYSKIYGPLSSRRAIRRNIGLLRSLAILWPADRAWRMVYRQFPATSARHNARRRRVRTWTGLGAASSPSITTSSHAASAPLVRRIPQVTLVEEPSAPSRACSRYYQRAHPHRQPLSTEWMADVLTPSPAGVRWGRNRRAVTTLDD